MKACCILLRRCSNRSSRLPDKRVDNAVYQIVQDVVNHEFRGGLHVFGLESEGVGYALDEYNKDLLSPDAVTAAEAAKKKIIAGEIKVTDAMFQ